MSELLRVNFKLMIEWPIFPTFWHCSWYFDRFVCACWCIVSARQINLELCGRAETIYR